MNSTKLADTLALIISLLSRRAFDELYHLDRNKRLLPQELAGSIDEYGGEVTPPKPLIWNYDFYPIDGTEDVFVDCDLFIDYQLSDLTLQCLMHEESQEGRYAFSIQNIHVM
ncbi:DUF7668 domain-containing protein [Hymenobacter bucti]|uniref:DUF7668 domain-containing protein n=1 Tax=Hymenobacter bucti TaxID=1844114 RepID=A0ABW4QZ05_9BACT